MSTRILFMGTPDFAVPVLRALVESPLYDVVGVVTQPDRPVGRKRMLTPSPVKVEAEKHDIPIFQPNKVRTPDSLEQLRALDVDVCVTAAYGQLLPQALLDMPKVGCLNVHASLLPRWRGAAPIHRAIIEGDKVTGVTIMEMVLALDAGPMLDHVEVPIEPNDNVGSLHDKLASAGAQILQRVLPSYIDGTLNLTPQPEIGVTYAERIQRVDEFVRFEDVAKNVYNHIRGMSPWPGATALLGSSPVKLWSARYVDVDDTATGTPGKVSVHGGRVFVRCSDHSLELLEVQPSGKRRMPASDWARGLSAETIQFDPKGLPE